MASELFRARFTFGRDFEVRYIAIAPVAGDLVAHGRELWVVARTNVDQLGLTVVCRLHPSVGDKTAPDQV